MRSAEAATGLDGRELDVIALLGDTGEASVKSLVADLDLPRSSMTAIVDRLEARRFIDRLPNPLDGRSITLRATPLATEALERYRAGIARLVPPISRQLDEDERRRLALLIRKLVDSL